jgi:hypothetical protein
MIKQPNFISKSLSISCISALVIFLAITSYLVSSLQGEIQSNNFTISQAIASGNKPSMIILLVLAFSILSYLTYYRGHPYLFLRLLMYLVSCSFIITIVWVTTYYNKEKHYILAGIIFTFFVTIIILNSYLIYNGLSVKTKTNKYILIGIPILAIIGLIGIGLGNLEPISNEVTQLFPVFENYLGIVMSLSIYTLGFM